MYVLIPTQRCRCITGASLRDQLNNILATLCITSVSQTTCLSEKKMSAEQRSHACIVDSYKSQFQKLQNGMVTLIF